MAQQPKKPQPPQQPFQQKLTEAAQKSLTQSLNTQKKVHQYNKQIKQYQDLREQKKTKIYNKNILQQYSKDIDNDIEVPVDGQLERGSRIFMVQCSSCHNLQPSSNAAERGPSLGLIFNRMAGNDVQYPSYSSAIANSRIYWTAKNLYNFMYNPQQVIQGTTCTIWKGDGIHSEQDRADLLAFFREYTRQLQKNLKLKAVKKSGYALLQTELYADQQEKKASERRKPQKYK